MSIRKFKLKSIIIALIIGLTIILIIASLFITPPNESLLSTLSLAFTAIGAVATVATFIIAILLYDKFGMEQKFIFKQIDKVLELIDVLKGKEIVVKTKAFNYFIHPSVSQLELLKNISFFKNDAKRNILVSHPDYTIGIKEIMIIKRSYWLPKEIKEKMEFLDIPGTYDVAEKDIEEFALISMYTGFEGKVGLVFPEMNFEYFINSIYDLMIEIEKWLKKHSSINLDFKMEEPEK